jgi:hypothetical protein
VIWVALSRSEAKRVLSWRVKWAMGLVRERRGMLWNMVSASRINPNELLFSKLEVNGITGHLLSFLKALYMDRNDVQVKVGEAPSILSDSMVPCHLPQAKYKPVLVYLESSPPFSRPAMRKFQRPTIRAPGCLHSKSTAPQAQ